jgi:hypothetical protein
MRLEKMLLLIGASLVAIALAAPGAQANVKLTNAEGETFLTKTKITVTSTDLQTMIAAGHVKCKKVTFHYQIGNAGPTQVTLEPVGTHNATAEECRLIKTPGGTTFETHITNAGTGEITIDTWGKGTATKTTFTADATGLGHCTFTGDVGLQATGGSGLTIGPSGLEGGLCGPGSIKGTATLELSNGEPVTLDFTKTG